MADISKITLPSGTTYDIKDAVAREAVSSFTKWLGVTTTELTDGASTNPITIDGDSVTAENGNIASYGNKEFIFNGSTWQEFGDLGALGNMAYADTATGSVTPSGSVSLSTSSETPTISVDSAGATTTIKNPTKATVALSVAAAAPGQTAPDNAVTYYSVANETLSLYQLGYTTGDSISTSDVTVKTGDASYKASAISVPTSASFSGSASSVTVTPDSE